MITPAYALTSTERVLPRLALDFTTGVLDPRVTVTRALNTATRVNSSGYIEAVNADLPRFDYSPTSVGTPRGLLIEESRANLILQSQAFNTASWAPDATTVLADAIASPDGTVNADRLSSTLFTGQTYITQFATPVAATAYVFSVYLKVGTQNFVQLLNTGDAQTYVNFNILTGVVGTSGSKTTGAITPVGNSWYRCEARFNSTSALNVAWRVSFAPSASAGFAATTFAGTGAENFYLWGAQLEAGAFATSYIPTTTTSLTRNADAVSMTGTNFSDWYNATEGAFVIDVNNFSSIASAAATFISANDNPLTNDWILMYGDSTYTVSNYTTAGSSQANFLVASSISTGGKVAFAYAANNFATSVKGGTVSSDPSGTLNSDITILRIGAFSANPNYLNGCMRKISYWPQRLTNAELQAFSK